MDASDTFFYCDPPYWGTEGYYDGVKFDTEDHIILRDQLLSIDGKFLLSYNDDPNIRDLYEEHGLYIEEISRLDNLRQFSVAGSTYTELLMRKLSRVFKSPRFDYMWADEETGKSAGLISFCDGAETPKILPEAYSREAYELAFDAFGTQPEDHGLVPDADTYIYQKEKETYEDNSENP